MKLAGMNITYRHYPLTYFLDSMKRLEIDTIELWAGEPHLFVYRNLLANLREVRREINKRGLKVACLTPEQCVYPYNLASSNDDWRKKSIDYFKENIYVAAELDTKMMLITSGIGDFSAKYNDSWCYAMESIMQLTNIAEREGIHLALEPLTRYETNLIRNRHQVKEMIDVIGSSSLKAMIDTVAMHLENESVEQYIELFGNDLIHFHLVDGDGHSDEHLSIGDGVLPIQDYLKTLREYNYHGTCTLEIMGYKNYLDPEATLRKSLENIGYFNGDFSSS